MLSHHKGFTTPHRPELKLPSSLRAGHGEDQQSRADGTGRVVPDSASMLLYGSRKDLGMREFPVKTKHCKNYSISRHVRVLSMSVNLRMSLKAADHDPQLHEDVRGGGTKREQASARGTTTRCVQQQPQHASRAGTAGRRRITRAGIPRATASRTLGRAGSRRASLGAASWDLRSKVFSTPRSAEGCPGGALEPVGTQREEKPSPGTHTRRQGGSTQPGSGCNGVIVASLRATAPA